MYMMATKKKIKKNKFTHAPHRCPNRQNEKSAKTIQGEMPLLRSGATPTRGMWRPYRVHNVIYLHLYTTMYMKAIHK